MNKRFTSHIFWGSHSVFSSLIGLAIILLASNRMAYALISSGAIIWVFTLNAVIFSAAQKILPVQGRKIILLFLSAFLCGLYFLLIGFFNPLIIYGLAFILVLIPPCCLGNGFYENLSFYESRSSIPVKEVFFRALLEALVLSGIIICLALIREPLGMGTLSFPGGIYGIREIGGDGDKIIPFRIFSISAGGILLLGYGIALFKYIKSKNNMTMEEDL